MHNVVPIWLDGCCLQGKDIQVLPTLHVISHLLNNEWGYLVELASNRKHFLLGGDLDIILGEILICKVIEDGAAPWLVQAVMVEGLADSVAGGDDGAFLLDESNGLPLDAVPDDALSLGPCDQILFVSCEAEVVGLSLVLVESLKESEILSVDDI